MSIFRSNFADYQKVIGSYEKMMKHEANIVASTKRVYGEFLTEFSKKQPEEIEKVLDKVYKAGNSYIDSLKDQNLFGNNIIREFNELKILQERILYEYNSMLEMDNMAKKALVDAEKEVAAATKLKNSGKINEANQKESSAAMAKKRAMDLREDATSKYDSYQRKNDLYKREFVKAWAGSTRTLLNTYKKRLGNDIKTAEMFIEAGESFEEPVDTKAQEYRDKYNEFAKIVVE